MELSLKNYMEDMVMAKMPSVMKQMNICECEQCRMDILAYVLNKMPPKYVVTQKGSMYAKLALLQSQFDVDILSNLSQAAAMVKKNPRHKEE
ncbi:MAG: late competence development ComFB family protein [Defluviitaleaceae bacterium]|nr:late competence development ComFB family protein [Defluviitaleaceae bacterium]MCL2239458.1 late competence development ComFB family protein [Defluviitaleaceae bacterium]